FTGLCRKLNKSHAQIGRATDGRRRPQNLKRSAAQILELLAHELAAILLFERKPDFDFPSEASQMFRCNQGIARVVAFPSKHNAWARLRKKFGHCLRDTGPCLVHKRFDLYAACKRGLFCDSHLRRTQDRQVQISPPDLLSPRVLLSWMISMSFSFFARFFYANAWSCGVRISLPSFVR